MGVEYDSVTDYDVFIRSVSFVILANMKLIRKFNFPRCPLLASIYSFIFTRRWLEPSPHVYTFEYSTQVLAKSLHVHYPLLSPRYVSTFSSK